MYGVWSWGSKTKRKTRGPGDHCKLRKMIKDVRWSGWVWVGECFFWYWPTRVVPDQRPLNGCVCVICCQLAEQVWFGSCRWLQCLWLLNSTVARLFAVVFLGLCLGAPWDGLGLAIFCIWPSWCHCHSLSLASVKSWLVLPFWYWLTRVVLDKELSNGCVSPLGVGLKVCGLVLDSASLGLGLAKMVFLTSLAVCALYYAVESTKATRQNSAVHPTTFRSSSKWCCVTSATQSICLPLQRKPHKPESCRLKC